VQGGIATFVSAIQIGLVFDQQLDAFGATASTSHNECRFALFISQIHVTTVMTHILDDFWLTMPTCQMQGCFHLLQ
jgi:hypothetical protein